MAFEAGLKTYLDSKTAITNIVGTRIYLDTAPQGVTSPYLIYQEVDSQTEHHMTGASALRGATYQFDCYASGSLQVKQLADSVRQSLDGYRGAMGSETVRMCHLTSSNGAPITAEDGEEQGLKLVTLDFDIWYVEDVPSFS